ncbi:MAG: hypothetical protein ACREFP_13060 [Acetobacteraceae bacterium]
MMFRGPAGLPRCGERWAPCATSAIKAVTGFIEDELGEAIGEGGVLVVG